MNDYEWVDVDEETFDKFLKNYPRKLVENFYMDYYSFYDFTLKAEPCVDSEVAYCSIYDEYSIRKDVMEVKCRTRKRSRRKRQRQRRRNFSKRGTITV